VTSIATHCKVIIICSFNNVDVAVMASTANFSCPLCSNAAHLMLDFKGLIKHLNLFHAHQPDFKVPCGINGCLRHFTNLRTYQNHVSSVHSFMGVTSSIQNSSASTSGCISDSHENNSSANGNDISSTTAEEESTFVGFNGSIQSPALLFQKSSALFLLGLKEKYKLTQISIQGIVDGVTSLTQCNMSVLKSQVCLYQCLCIKLYFHVRCILH